MEVKDWSGGFILHGDAQFSTFFPFLQDPIYGSFDAEGSHFCESTGVGAYVMNGTPCESIPVSTKSQSVISWYSGANDVSAITKRLLSLNKLQRFETAYTETLRNEVFKEQGCWSATIATLSRQSNIILAAKNQAIYLWLVRWRGAFLLVWSTDPMHMEQVRSLLPEMTRDLLMFVRIEIANSICVLHPTFLLGRFKRAWNKMYWTDRLAVVSYITTHIRKRIQPLNGGNNGY